MTLEEYLTQFCGPHCYGEQDENGVDLSLIRDNLRLSPEERLVRGDNARHGVLELQRHARRIDTVKAATSE